jgi:hypothetical protein
MEQRHKILDEVDRLRKNAEDAATLRAKMLERAIGLEQVAIGKGDRCLYCGRPGWEHKRLGRCPDGQ